MDQQVELRAYGVDDPRVAMSGGGDAEPGGEVDVDVAVDIEDVGAQRLAPEDGELVGDEGDVGRLVPAQRRRQPA